MLKLLWKPRNRIILSFWDPGCLPAKHVSSPLKTGQGPGWFGDSFRGPAVWLACAHTDR